MFAACFFMCCWPTGDVRLADLDGFPCEAECDANIRVIRCQVERLKVEKMWGQSFGMHDQDEYWDRRIEQEQELLAVWDRLDMAHFNRRFSRSHCDDPTYDVTLYVEAAYWNLHWLKETIGEDAYRLRLMPPVVAYYNP